MLSSSIRNGLSDSGGIAAAIVAVVVALVIGGIYQFVVRKNRK